MHLRREDFWSDWIPGVLSEEQVLTLCRERGIRNTATPFKKSIDASALDLHLSDRAYRMKSGSVKPLKNIHYRKTLEEYAEELPTKSIYTLEARKTYVFELRERLEVDTFQKANIFGEATARSSVGRVDVLARLIVDGADRYEGFIPDELSTGDLFIEITPMTFDVRVKKGISLSQLRLFIGQKEGCKMRGTDISKCTLGNEDGTLSLNLTNLDIGGLQAAAFYVPREFKAPKPVCLWDNRTKADPCEYWRIQRSIDRRMTITAGDFYILRSKERIILPPGVAVYCRPSDETLGEMRIHYAGFVHPHFGTTNRQGSPLIFEVRGHDFDVNLVDGEKMAQLTFYRMSQDSVSSDQSYEGQELDLSKYFAKWPAKLQDLGEGLVEAGE